MQNLVESDKRCLVLRYFDWSFVCWQSDAS